MYVGYVILSPEDLVLWLNMFGNLYTLQKGNSKYRALDWQ